MKHIGILSALIITCLASNLFCMKNDQLRRMRSGSARHVLSDTIEMETTPASSDDITKVSTSQRLAFTSELKQQRNQKNDEPKEIPIEDDASEIDELEEDHVHTQNDQVYLDEKNNLHLCGWHEVDGHDYVFPLTKPILTFKTKKWKIYQTYITAQAHTTVCITIKRRLSLTTGKRPYKFRFDRLVEAPETSPALHVREYRNSTSCTKMYHIMKAIRKKQQDRYREHTQESINVVLAHELKRCTDEKIKKF